MQPALQDEPRRSRGVLGLSLAENQPKTKKNSNILSPLLAPIGPYGPLGTGCHMGPFTGARPPPASRPPPSAAARWGFSRWGFNDLMENRSLWGSGRPLGALEPSKKVGGEAPLFFLDGSRAPRSRSDPQNDRFSIKSLNPHRLNPHRAAADIKSEIITRSSLPCLRHVWPVGLSF